MLFNLEVLSNGQNKVIHYNNITNIFTDTETGKAFFDEFPAQDYARQSDIFSIDFQNIGALYIQLGLKCNFHCKYCHQNQFRKTTQVADFTPDRVDSFIDILRRNHFKMNSIAFWGGEPFVYWKALQRLIPKLREMYPDILINFPTNGSLIDKKKLAFLEHYNIHFYISYDGKQTNRDVSVFDRKALVECLRSLKGGVDIMATQNRASIPIRAVREEFREKKLNLHSLAAYTIARCNPFNSSQASEIYIPDEKLNRHSEFIYDVLHDRVEDGYLYRGVVDRFEHLLKVIAFRFGIDSQETIYCANSLGRDVTIDCTGAIFNCMNIPVYKLGTVDTFKPFDKSAIFKSPLKRQPCLECPFLTVCRGGCPLVHDEESEVFKVNCHNLKCVAVPFFRTLIERLFGMYLKRIVRTTDGKVFGEFL